MIDFLRNLFKPAKKVDLKKYKGLSDFLANSTSEEQKEVFMMAARKANEDQSKIFREAKMKVGAN